MNDFLKFFDEKTQDFPMHLEITYSKICDWGIYIYKRGCANDYPKCRKDGDDAILVHENDTDMELCFAKAHVALKEWGVDADMPDYFECIHNYIDHDSNIVRKGAISAKYGEKVLIPINMRDGCIIGTGKGNEDWNCSAPHGAGRVMSRTKAKELVSLEEFEKSMDGIYTTSVNQSTIDESPMAYKTLDEIVENIKDTVDVLAIIKPVYNFKASE